MGSFILPVRSLEVSWRKHYLGRNSEDGKDLTVGREGRGFQEELQQSKC